MKTKNGDEKITFTDIANFSALTRMSLHPWEVASLVDMHDTLTKEVSRPPPDPPLTMDVFDQMFTFREP